MKIIKFYDRVVETTGLDVLTLESLTTAIENCIADLSSRGYRELAEISITEYTNHGNNMVSFPQPSDTRKILYIKAFFPDGIFNAARVSLAEPHLGTRYVNGSTARSNLYLMNQNCIYYVKGGTIYIEWLGNSLPVSFTYGYNKIISIPTFTTKTDGSLADIEIPIRKEFEDALVMYGCFFYTQRYLKDLEKTSMFLNQYKYYVEDIMHELAYEDSYATTAEVVVLDD